MVKELELETVMIVGNIPRKWSMLHVMCMSMKRITRTTKHLQIVWLTVFEPRWRLLGLRLVFDFSLNMGFVPSEPLARDYLVMWAITK